MGLTLPELVKDEARAITNRPKPAHSRANENLEGLEGWRFPHRAHSHANTGASVRMKNELTD